MRHRFIFTALLGLGSAALLATSASAGGWGCGSCGYPAYAPPVTYAAPTYSYAPPTVTVIPHYVVQPHYVIEQTRVLRPTYYVRSRAPWRYRHSCCGCGRGFFVNQGQFDTYAPLIPRRGC